MAVDSLQQLPAVGSRVSYTSNIGTVRFVGEVIGTKGVWLGVEWDDPQRGRHSGSKDGKQYFTCKVPNAGSFIRPNASVTFGRSFLQALTSKYVELPLEAAAEKVVLGSSNGAIEVEAVGLNKIRSKLSNLERLREVSLDMENVAYADEPGHIRLTCPNIKGLNLSRSLLSSWKEVARIAEELPQLETLCLNHNRLQLSRQDEIGTAFAHVRDLQLNGTLMTWDEMLTLLPSFPNLLQLELGLNNLTSPLASIPSPSFQKIISFNLEENRLVDWQNTMEALAPFQALERLVLSRNTISSVTQPSPTARKLQHVKYLALTSNEIYTWLNISLLPAWFPQLQTLNIGSNPIFRDSSARPLIIARIPTLITLNSSAISPSERQDSELYYLSHISKNGPPSDEAREQEYPGYLRLCEKHGRPVDRQELPPDTLKNRLIEMKFFRLPRDVHANPPKDMDLSTPDKSLKVLPNMSLHILRAKVSKTLKLPSSTSLRMWLALERPGGSSTWREFVELDMEAGDRALEWWGVEDKCKIVYCTE